MWPIWKERTNAHIIMLSGRVKRDFKGHWLIMISYMQILKNQFSSRSRWLFGDLRILSQRRRIMRPVKILNDAWENIFRKFLIIMSLNLTEFIDSLGCLYAWTRNIRVVLVVAGNNTPLVKNRRMKNIDFQIHKYRAMI